MNTRNLPEGEHRMIFKAIFNGALILFFSIFLIVSLNLVQNAASRQRQHEDSLRILNEMVQTITQNQSDAAQMQEIYHNSNRETLADLQRMFSSGLLDSYVSADAEERSKGFGEIMERAGVKYLFIMNSSGNVVLASDPSAAGASLQALGLLTEEQISALVNGETVDCDNGQDSLYFYASPLETSYGAFYIVLGEDSSILDEQYNSLTNLGDLIGSTSVSGTGFIFAVDTEKKTFLYYNDGETEMSGQAISACGLNSDVLRDNYEGLQTINGKEYYCVSRLCGDVVIITAAVTTDTIYADNTKVVFWSAVLFLMTAIISLSYAIFVRNDLIRQQVKPELKPLFRLKNGSTVVVNRSVGRKILPVMGIGLLLIFGACFYVQTLLSLSGAVTTSGNTLQEIEKKVIQSEELRSDIQNYYESRFLARTKLVSYMLEVDPSVLNKGNKMTYSEYDEKGVRHTIPDEEGNPLQSVANSELLQKLCDDNDMEEVYVFDSQGHTIAVNGDFWFFIVSRNEGDQSYPFLQVVDGRLASLIQDAQTDERGLMHQYIGTTFHYYTFKDADGNTAYASQADYESQRAGTWTGNPITRHSSMLQAAVSNTVMSNILNSTEVSYIVNHTTVYQNGFVLVFDSSDEHKLICSPYADDTTKQNAADLGLGGACFSGSYNGFRKIDGIDYFLCCRLYHGYYLCTAIPTDELYSQRLRISFITLLISLICLIFMSGLLVFTTDAEEKLFERMAADVSGKYREERVTVTTSIDSQKTTQSTQSAAARLDGRWRKWINRTPEQKLVFLLGVCGFLLIIYLLITIFFIKSIFGTESILNYIISGEWEHSPSIFSLTACGMLLISTIVCVGILRALIDTITRILGVKSETMGKLVISILKYGGVLVGLFYCLYMVGFDASSLIASAGILSVIIGLGAQSLIGDILAGIFIVFEGEFRVGDIVTIDGFRGRVLEIGLRTTKIVDTTQNIKIFSNSKISGVLNMTKRVSYARCEIGISYGQSLEEVELVLKKELPNVRKNVPLLLKDPVYKGVLRFDDKAVVIRIQAECLEGDRTVAVRALNREILLIFNRNHIEIPLPQMTLSMLKTDKHEITQAIRDAARDFVAEQLAGNEMDNEHDDGDSFDDDDGDDD